MLNILILWFVVTVFYTCKVRFDCDTNREARVNALRASTFDKWVVFMCLKKAIWLVKRNSFQDKKRYMPLLIIYPMGWNLTVFAYRTHSFSGDAWLVKNILRDAWFSVIGTPLCHPLRRRSLHWKTKAHIVPSRSIDLWMLEQSFVYGAAISYL